MGYEKKKSENNFMPSMCKEGSQDWIVIERAFKLEEMIRHLESLRVNGEKDPDQWVNTQIKRAMKDPSKVYESLNTFKPDKSKVSAKEHMPDREEVSDDLPY